MAVLISSVQRTQIRKRVWNSDVKNFVRRQIVSHPENKPAAKAVLLLPGINALCLRQAISCGLVDKQTHCYLVERDPLVAKKLWKSINDCDLADYDLTLLRQELYDINFRKAIPDMLDYVYLDLCSGPNSKLGSLITNKIVPRLANKAQVAVTLCRRPATRFFESVPGVLVQKIDSNTGHVYTSKEVSSAYTLPVRSVAGQFAGGNRKSPQVHLGFRKEFITDVMWACIRWYRDCLEAGIGIGSQHPDVRLKRVFGYSSPDGTSDSRRAAGMCCIKAAVNFE